MEPIAGSSFPPEYAAACRSWTFALAATAGPTPATYAQVQLFNPPASGQSIILLSARVSLLGNGQLQAGFYNTALTTDAGQGTLTHSGAAPSGVAHVYTQTNASVLGSALIILTPPANTPQEMITPWLWVLDPGVGFITQITTVNTEIYTTFVWAVGV